MQTFCTLMKYLSKNMNITRHVILLYKKDVHKGNPDRQKSSVLAKLERSAWVHHSNFIIILK